ncbi:hypothetical protein LCGC14_0577100 [marine sediment metagenome]|uniref:Uncharacterized protein n=1 Tax=marine sediment metagenome TaxID=412755 RepID=A0A0F9UQU3_9ZZZZ
MKAKFLKITSNYSYQSNNHGEQQSNGKQGRFLTMCSPDTLKGDL